MTVLLPDANVLISALNQSSAHHQPCRQWLLHLSEHELTLGLCELVEVALLRIPTLPRLNLIPMTSVMGFWFEDLWTYPHAVRLSAGEQHRVIFSRLAAELDVRGNDVNDAWLAALAIEHGATLVSTDSGFTRFRPGGLDWLNPLAQ